MFPLMDFTNRFIQSPPVSGFSGRALVDMAFKDLQPCALNHAHCLISHDHEIVSCMEHHLFCTVVTKLLCIIIHIN